MPDTGIRYEPVSRAGRNAGGRHQGHRRESWPCRPLLLAMPTRTQRQSISLRNLRDAKEALHGSDMLRAAMGDDVIDHYTRAAEWELEEFDRVVTDWEIARGFERA